MTERKIKFINYWAVEDMIDKRINVLDEKAIEHDGKISIDINFVIKLFMDLKEELNEEWHREIEEWFEE